MRALEGVDRSQDARRDVTVMPAGAPLLGRLTPIDNCRAYAGIFGGRPTHAETLTCLRTLDMPDRLAGRPAEELSELHRVLTWLAMARLVSTPVIVLVEPLTWASQAHRAQLCRVLQEAAARHRHIFVTAQHQDSAIALGAQRVPLAVESAP